jgi:outer membrane lipoprotein LolB
LAFYRLIPSLVWLLLVGGCALQPPIRPAADIAVHTDHLKQLANIQSFHLQGRLAVNTNGKGYSGSMAWQHQTNTDTIDVFTPLGSKIAHIEKTDAQVTLTNAKGEQINAQDAESLTEKALGWRLPLKGLSDWALGRPTQAPITQQQWDASGKLTLLEQQGWKIEYLEYQDKMAVPLPQKITLRRENILLKLVVEQWQAAP